MSTLMLGILSKAAYLLIEEGENEHYGITVTGLGEIEQPTFILHALSPTYLEKEETFMALLKGYYKLVWIWPQKISEGYQRTIATR